MRGKTGTVFPTSCVSTEGCTTSQKNLPEFCDARLRPTLALRANADASGKDHIVLETLAQAYWLNGNRDDAVRSIEDALVWMDAPKPGEAPTLSWTEFSTLLRG